MNVHLFDGKLKEFYIEKGRISDVDKKQMFNELSELLDQDGKNGLSLIINNQNNSNYDPINKLDANDILAEICDYITKETDKCEESKGNQLNEFEEYNNESKDKESNNNKEKLKDIKNIINNINEQLKDMFLTGQCAQGRTIRLWQILKFIRNE